MNIQSIIAPFLGVSEGEITNNTSINRTALKSSIFLHRMYGKLADAGFVVNDYSNINTVGELTQLLNGTSTNGETYKSSQPIIAQQLPSLNQSSIGLDLQPISEMPIVNDFRADGFYRDNFTEKEISYCIVQANPYASFAGLFAVKEAIVKADKKFKKHKFNQLSITHDEAGKPVFEGFAISISHTNEQAVAVAVLDKIDSEKIVYHNTSASSVNFVLLIIAILALVISIFSLLKH